MIKTDTAQVAAHDGGAFEAYLALPEQGRGPGLVLLQEIFGVNDTLESVARRFAEEGYVVLVPDLFWRLERNVRLGYGHDDMGKALSLYQRFDQSLAVRDVLAAATALRKRPECTGPVGAMGFCLGGTLALLAAAEPGIDATVAYYPVGVQHLPDLPAKLQCPTTIHFGERDSLCPPEQLQILQARFAANPLVKTFIYPGAPHAFYNHDRPEYDRIAASLSHTRTLELLRGELGPQYDLAALWDKHLMCEFAARNADDTLATMVDEPYVNHVPTMTGGIGRRELRHFYQHYFVHVHDENMRMIPVSRTVGVNRVVDEMVACFRHDRLIDYLLPGVPPTGRDVKLPMVAIASFRGERLYHEHLYWDHATLLAQIGMLDTRNLPVTGAEQADKVLDETSSPSNALMSTWRPPEP